MIKTRAWVFGAHKTEKQQRLRSGVSTTRHRTLAAVSLSALFWLSPLIAGDRR